MDPVIRFISFIRVKTSMLISSPNARMKAIKFMSGITLGPVVSKNCPISHGKNIFPTPIPVINHLITRPVMSIFSPPPYEAYALDS